MTSMRVLLLASEPTTQRRLQLLLDEHEWLAVAVGNLAEARRLLRSELFAAVVVDGRSDPDRELVAELGARARATGRDSSPPPSLPSWSPEALAPPVVVLVDGADPTELARLLGLGVADVVERGLLDALLAHRLRMVVRSAGAERTRPGPTPGGGGEGALRRAGRRRSDLLIGRSPLMLALAKHIDMIAKTDIGVAVYGETGTGKDLVARTIHALSPRARKPFVVANCTALPEALFENELFGHERGAFTGADTRQEGLIREAEGGSLVLDEIGDLKGGVQAKLLRLLQSREFKMIGGSKTLHADVRILATTHRDLRKAVQERRFREDLYYRLNTLQVTLPPLRDRLEDIALLVDHFVALFNEREGRDFQGFTPSAIRRLHLHRWPGNVRELESVVYRSLVMAGSRRLLEVEDVQLGQEMSATDLDPNRPFAELKSEAVERFERYYLENLMRRTGGNLAHAARAAQHERKSLWRLLRKYDLEPKTFRPSKG
jgi:two-component system response regulator GlrR